MGYIVVEMRTATPDGRVDDGSGPYFPATTGNDLGRGLFRTRAVVSQL